jgi:hypothetical protein
MRSPRFRAKTLILVVALVLFALPVASASATVETSQITTPAGLTFPLDDLTLSEGGPTITVAGNVTGISNVDVRCYFGSGTSSNEYKTLATDVAVSGEKFTTPIKRSAFEHSPLCVLRAVPHGTSPAGSDESFAGPTVAPTLFEESPPDEYSVDSNTLTANFLIDSATGCALGSNLYAAPLEPSIQLFYCDGDLHGDPEGPRSDIQIDGANAYGPASARELEETLKSKGAITPFTGAPKLGVTKEFHESNGIIEIHEVDPLVRCNTNTAPPTTASCTEFIGTGVTLERTWQETENNHIAWMTDTWRSTDGSAHTVNARYFTEMNASGKGEGVYEFPGSTGFATTVKGQSIALPAGDGAILYKTKASTPEGGDDENPQGAIVYDSAPTEPLAVTVGSKEEEYNVFEMPYQHTIAAGSSYTIRMAYIQAFGLPEVHSLAAAALASYPPTVTITSPANGATLTSPSVTVTGTAKDTGALSSLTVNGAPVTIAAGGSWTTTVPLKAGANAITAIATDQAGLTSSSSVAVTYTPPPAKPAPATASQVGNVSGSKGQATLSLACHGTAGTSCKVHVTLTTVEKLRHGHLIGIAAAKTHSKTVTVATLTITIPAGQTVKVTLKLNATGRKLLKRFGKLPSHITAILEGEAGHHTVVAQNLTIKPVPKKHKH